jgi:hypothetical protein
VGHLHAEYSIVGCVHAEFSIVGPCPFNRSPEAMTLAGFIDPERVRTRRCCGPVTSTIFYDVSADTRTSGGRSADSYLNIDRITPSFSENAHGFYRVCGIEAINYPTIVVLWKKACLWLGRDRNYKCSGIAKSSGISSIERSVGGAPFWRSTKLEPSALMLSPQLNLVDLCTSLRLH